MRKYILILMSTLALTLSACGGGGSSSGGGDNSFSGTFTGQQTATVTVLGESITETGAFAMLVTGNTVSITDSGVTGTGTLSGGSFTVTLPSISATQSGITCSVAPTYTGTISGNNVSGNISGTFNCTGGITGSITGSFTATRGSGKQLNKSLKDIIKQAISEVN